ncbi:NUDIX domain-containing protein [Paenibacillus zeisoli]|uniref:NUDIX domain-containing protein n=1 Tax=Paenibacillus zeisoli TaxID=2496267 RepID=A0A3S1D6N8_9BACL|nr:NUDIX domain-containing protein [Paenibacillus zeisoli]RUT28027.1 NUDIX domain-containing protein [Paenibacillus zeisoli]
MKIKYSIECWIVTNNYVLLLEVKKGKRNPNFLQPVTGGIVAGESSILAACREINEETGLKLQPNQLELIIKDYEVYIPEEELKIMKDAFLLRLKRQFEVCISDEHVGYWWVHRTEVKKQLYYESNKETFTLIEKHL